MRTKGLTTIEMAVLVIATVILLMALLTFNANAQELTSLAGKTTIENYKQEKGPASIKSSSDNSTSDNSTMTKADILKERGVPGKGIDHAPGLQKPFNPKSSAADNAGKKNGSSTSDNTTSPPPTSDNSTTTNAEILKQSGLPGKGTESAPGLQKNSNPNADENVGINKFIYRWQQRFQEMLQKYFKRANGKK